MCAPLAAATIGATNVARKSPALGVATCFSTPPRVWRRFSWQRVLFSGPHQQLIMTTAAFFAVLGHLFPVWLKFRGGKGVATSLGAFIFLTPKSILCMVVLFLLIAVAFRYVSLGSVVVAAAFPLLAWALREYVDSRQLIFIALVSAACHLETSPKHLGRLASGTESKLGTKSGGKPAAKLKSRVATE